MSKIARKSKWSIDFTSPPKGIVVKSSRPKDNPVGYIDQKINAQSQAQASDSKLISKRSWNIALGPIKQLPMNLFIMYMSGSSISIFPIMIICMMVFRPIKAMLAYKSSFKMLDVDSQAILQKIVWVFGNCLGIAVALYKCHSMGLLPTAPSDWLAFKEHRTREEFIMGGFV